MSEANDNFYDSKVYQYKVTMKIIGYSTVAALLVTFLVLWIIS